MKGKKREKRENLLEQMIDKLGLENSGGKGGGTYVIEGWKRVKSWGKDKETASQLVGRFQQSELRGEGLLTTTRAESAGPKQASNSLQNNRRVQGNETWRNSCEEKKGGGAKTIRDR